MPDPPLPDFREIKRTFDGKLTPGHRAEIRRVGRPPDLALRPAFYRLLPKGVHPSEQLRRVAFLLPWASQKDDAPSIGAQIATSKKVSEMRLFQMARTDDAELALERLRRLCRHVQPAVDWAEFGRTLYYWGDRAKRRIVEDYFTTGGRA